MFDRRVVITGMGVVCPLGNNVDQFWSRLIAGESGIAPIQRFDVSKFDVTIGGECTEFVPDPVIDKRAAKRLDRFAQFAMVAADEAFRHAGFEPGKLPDPDRVGVITGTGIGGIFELEEQHSRLESKGPSKVSAFTIPKLMSNAGSGNISIHYGARGPSTAVGTACASATNAMGDALAALRRGDVDVCLTGGSEAALTPLGLAAFASMKALSTRNDDPTRASRPFDKDRDGFVMGEGAGMVVFEEYEHAKKRGANIICEVLGFGTSADAYHITQPMETGAGAAAAMRRAMKDAKINPEQMAHINAHGTSTPLGDVAETVAIKSVYGEHAKNIRVTSTKSSIGHLLGASGGVEIAATALAMVNGVVPPTINLDHQDPQCDLNYTPNTAQDARVPVAMCNSFGFGGHNACVILGLMD